MHWKVSSSSLIAVMIASLKFNSAFHLRRRKSPEAATLAVNKAIRWPKLVHCLQKMAWTVSPFYASGKIDSAAAKLAQKCGIYCHLSQIEDRSLLFWMKCGKLNFLFENLILDSIVEKGKTD